MRIIGLLTIGMFVLKTDVMSAMGRAAGAWCISAGGRAAQTCATYRDCPASSRTTPQAVLGVATLPDRALTVALTKGGVPAQSTECAIVSGVGGFSSSSSHVARGLR